ncbi:MAG TPA: methionyl-tRNA formyltransferase [Chlamydiales bacterium]|nr:methionyl-tRNA formyltransferase [Chlamydiales bacterium]
MKTKIVYFGTPQFAANVLEYLAQQNVPIVGIVTQPDRPKGRSNALEPSPVKKIAGQCFPNVPILQPEKASQEEFLQQLQSLNADLYVVVAYGQILTQKLLSIPPKGCINVHASLLPKYRGAAPMQRCLMAGERVTGICIQKMVRQLDAGDVIATAKMEIPQNMNLGELETSLCNISKTVLLQVIREFEDKIPDAIAQDHSLATYASKIDPAEGEIHWDEPAEKIHHLIRAFSPKPGAWIWLEPQVKKMKILRSELIPDQQGKAGTVLSKDGIVACGQGSIRILEVQPEGKKCMHWEDWYRGTKNLLSF